MYKIGDKVEYLNNVWEVYDYEIDSVEIYNDKLGINIYVPISDVQPYHTAHEKLIEMGYEEKIHDTVVKSDVESGKYKQYAKNCEVILIDIKDREFTTYTLYSGDKGVSDVSWVNHKLSRILTQYLEELEEVGKEE